MNKLRLKHIPSGKIIEFKSKLSYEYCLDSSSYELCHILSDLDNSGEFEPVEEIEEKKQDLNELEEELMSLSSTNIKKKNRK